MELDGFCESLDIAFEYQGLQHYKHVEYFQTKAQFEKRQQDDERKQSLCKKNGIVLISVPEIGRYLNKTNNDVIDFIVKECRKADFQKIPKNIEYKNIDLIEVYSPDTEEHLNILNTIARKKGGKCLSEIYLGNEIKLTFQ